MTVICIKKSAPDMLPGSCWPQDRLQAILSANNPVLRALRIASTAALEEALSLFDGSALCSHELKMNAAGKWVCPDFYLSLTHTRDLAAAAVSDHPVGIDLELTEHFSKDMPRLEKLAARICLPGELQGDLTPEALLKLWASKEAIFKASDEPVFRPEQLRAAGSSVKIFEVPAGQGLFLAVSCPDTEDSIRFCPNAHKPELCAAE